MHRCCANILPLHKQHYLHTKHHQYLLESLIYIPFCNSCSGSGVNIIYSNIMPVWKVQISVRDNRLHACLIYQINLIRMDRIKGWYLRVLSRASVTTIFPYDLSTLPAKIHKCQCSFGFFFCYVPKEFELFIVLYSVYGK